MLDNYFNNSLLEDFFNFDSSVGTWPQSLKVRNKKPRNKITKSLKPRKSIENNGINNLLLTKLTNAPLMNLINTDFSRNGFSIKEKKDRYLVSYKDRDIKNKEFDINYHKKRHELLVSSRMKTINKQKNGNFLSSTSSKSCITLEKPVKYNEIKVKVEDDGLKITVPKLDSYAVGAAIEDDKENDKKDTFNENDERNENDEDANE